MTIDAMGCQRGSAQERQPGSLHGDVKMVRGRAWHQRLPTHHDQPLLPRYLSVNAGHGRRIETRDIAVIRDAAWPQKRYA